jgi:flagellar biosynthesis/type III secretory pathway protein FliH
MESDGKKKSGRFIKGGSSILDKVSLHEFSFDDISNAKTILPDNTRKNVIHAPYHETEDLKSAIKPFRRIEQELLPAHMKRPVITPLDFSKDWERAHRARQNRNHLHDDEEFDYEDAMAHARAARENAKHSGSSDDENSPLEINKSNRPSSERGHEKTHFESAQKSPPNHPVPSPDSTEPSSPRQFPSQLPNNGLNWGAIDIAGKALAELAQKAGTEIPDQEQSIGKHNSNLSSTEDFIPIASAPKDALASHDPQDPELASSMAYKARVAEKNIDQEELKQLVEEQKAQGYRDGFRIGEEKAELQIRAASKEMFEKIEGLIGDFQGLQKAMMDNVQENFFIVCQALAESLLKREFTIHPDAFNTVMEKAITEAIEPGKVKIRVHPDTYDRITAFGKTSLLDSIVKDVDVAPGDFKLESQMSVVDVNIGKLVAQLLSQADLNLFAEEEKAG